MNDPLAKCLVCERSIEDIPLVPIEYRAIRVYICPEHLPVLIHHPEQLVGKLPGAENLLGHSH